MIDPIYLPLIAVTPFALLRGGIWVVTHKIDGWGLEALPVASESKTDRLVAWNDAYNEVFDFADPEGSVYAALEAADKAVPPEPKYQTKLHRPVKPPPKPADALGSVTKLSNARRDDGPGSAA